MEKRSTETQTSDDEHFAVICNLVEDMEAEGTTPVRGSTQQECADCHKSLWASPRTVENVERAKKEDNITGDYMCVYCMIKRADDDPELREHLQKQGFLALPGAIEEVHEGLGDEGYAQHAFGQLGVKEFDPFEKKESE